MPTNTKHLSCCDFFFQFCARTRVLEDSQWCQNCQSFISLTFSSLSEEPETVEFAGKKESISERSILQLPHAIAVYLMCVLQGECNDLFVREIICSPKVTPRKAEYFFNFSVNGWIWLQRFFARVHMSKQNHGSANSAGRSLCFFLCVCFFVFHSSYYALLSSNPGSGNSRKWTVT